MPRNYGDNAPIGNTCPMIDNIIGRMEAAKNEAEYISKNPEQDSSEEVNLILGELVEAIKEMEDIRSANSELRDWGNEEHERANEAEKERDELTGEVDELKSKIENLKSEIEELE